MQFQSKHTSQTLACPSTQVPGHPSPRKALPGSTRIPEEVMAVMLKRKNTASSCPNTRSVAITASLPGTGTRNYRCLIVGVSVSPLPPPRSSAPTEHATVLSRESALRRCGTWTPISSRGAPGAANANKNWGLCLWNWVLRVDGFLLRIKRNTTVWYCYLLQWTKICINSVCVFLTCILRSDNYFPSLISAFEDCFNERWNVKKELKCCWTPN